MATTPGRIAATLLFAIAVVLVGVSLTLPWWGIGREAEGARSWERYGPFHRDVHAAANAFDQQTSTLGVLVIVGGVLLLVATVLHALHAMDARRPFSPGAAVAVFAVLALVAAALFVVFAFPQEASKMQSRKLTFVDRQCGSGFGLQLCFLTRPDVGWYLGAGSALLGVLGLSAGVLGKPDAEAMVRPRADGRPPLPAPALGARTAPATPAAAPGRANKCPQCQTKLSGSRPAGGMVTCHNCGLRFPA